MNSTEFCIYRSGISGMEGADAPTGDIKTNPLTRQLYVTNCDRRIAGNISSVYLTLVAAYNLASDAFYYRDPIVNTFMDKMENQIEQKVSKLAENLIGVVQKSPIAGLIMLHILADKFKKSPNKRVSAQRLTDSMVEMVLRHIVERKFEIRLPRSDLFDDFITYLSGEQESQNEISYTKQQQKQKQTQQNKNQDSDAMSLFHKTNQLTLGYVVTEYYEQTKRPKNDKAKILLNLPAHDPIVSFSYCTHDGEWRSVCVYPTLQFLYSHFIDGTLKSFGDSNAFPVLIQQQLLNALPPFRSIHERRRQANFSVL
jgi:menaquinone-dependent protoporphyrinogen IX oxidase